jgi:hypothetical protein
MHHGATDLISGNIQDQVNLAYKALKPVVNKAQNYFHIRGTEAHVGIQAVNEEILAEKLGAVKDEEGQFSRYKLRLWIGDSLADLQHHIGHTSSTAHESSALNAEISSAINNSARWGQRIPDFVVRGHRHRCICVDFDGINGYIVGAVCPCWQGYTPFLFKTGMRNMEPQFGGLLLRRGDMEHFLLRKVWSIDPPKEERIS